MDVLGTIFTLATILMTCFLEVCQSTECYSCIYTPHERSISSCRDPWPWLREAMDFVLGPPSVIECEGSCLKIVISHNNSPDTVVRTCNPTERSCNDSLSSTTVTSCCDTPRCNTAAVVTPTLWYCLSFVVLVNRMVEWLKVS